MRNTHDFPVVNCAFCVLQAIYFLREICTATSENKRCLLNAV